LPYCQKYTPTNCFFGDFAHWLTRNEKYRERKIFHFEKTLIVGTVEEGKKSRYTRVAVTVLLSFSPPQ